MSAGVVGGVRVDIDADLSKYVGKISEAKSIGADLIAQLEGHKPAIDLDVSALQNVTTETDQVVGSLDNVAAAADDASGAVGDLSGAASDVAGGLGEAEAAATTTGTALKNAGSQASLFSANLASVANIAKGFVLGGAIRQAPQLFLGMAKAAADDAASMARLQTAVTNAAGSWEPYASAINGAINAGQNLAFSDDDVRAALTTLVQQTGDVNVALERLATAEDFARGSGQDLATSARLLGKITDESHAALSRYGIQIDKTATSQEVLNAVDARFGGQAATFAASDAGKMAKAADAAGELQEALGTLAAPAITGLSEKVITLSQEVQFLVEEYQKLHDVASLPIGGQDAGDTGNASDFQKGFTKGFAQIEFVGNFIAALHQVEDEFGDVNKQALFAADGIKTTTQAMADAQAQAYLTGTAYQSIFQSDDSKQAQAQAQADAYALGHVYTTSMGEAKASVVDLLKSLVAASGADGAGAVFAAVEQGAITAKQAVGVFVSTGTVDFQTFRQAGETELQRLQTALAAALSPGGDHGQAQELQLEIDALTGALQTGSDWAGRFANSLNSINADQAKASMQSFLDQAVDKASQDIQTWQGHTEEAKTALGYLDEELKAGVITQDEYNQKQKDLQWYQQRTTEGTIAYKKEFSDAVDAEAKHMHAMDDLNQALKDGVITQQQYDDAVKDANKSMLAAGSPQDQLVAGFTLIDDSVEKLNQTLHDAFVALGILPPDPTVTLHADDEVTPTLGKVVPGVIGFTDGTYTATLGADDQASPTINDAKGAGDTFREGNYTATVGADKSGFDTAIGDAQGALAGLIGGSTGHSAAGALGGSPAPGGTSAYQVPIGADTSGFDTGIGTVTNALAGLPTSFTIYAYVDETQALQAISDIDAHLPHSPAEKGPLSKLPNWQWVFAGLPGAADAQITQAMTTLARYLPQSPPAAGPLANLTIDWSWLFKDIDMSADDAGERMGEAVAGWFQDLNALASGDTLKQAQDALTRLFDIRQILIETNAGPDAIAELDKEISDQQANITAIGAAMGTDVVQGLKDTLNAQDVAKQLIDTIQQALGGLDLSHIDFSQPVTIESVLAPIRQQIAALTAERDALTQLGQSDAAAQVQQQLDALNQQAIETTQLFGTDAVQAFIREQTALAQSAAAAQAATAAHQQLVQSGTDMVTALGQGGDAAAQFFTGIMTDFQNAQNALGWGQILDVPPDVLKTLNDNFDSAEAIFQQGMGTLKDMISKGLVDDITLQALVKQGGKAFETWYDQMFGPGAIEKIEAGWKKLVPVDKIAGLFDDLDHVSDDSLNNLVTAVQNGSVKIGDAFKLLSDASGHTSVEMEGQLLHLKDDVWQKYQEALLSGNEEAAKSYLQQYDVIIQVLQGFADANGETVDQLIQDWQRAADAAEKAEKKIVQASQDATAATTDAQHRPPSLQEIQAMQPPPATTPDSTTTSPLPQSLADALQLYQQLQAIADAPDLDAQKVADTVTTDVDIVISAFETAADRWSTDGLDALSKYVTVASQGMGLLSDTEDAFDRIGKGSAIAPRAMQIFSDNSDLAFGLIGDLADMARQYDGSASDLLLIATNMTNALTQTANLIAAVPAAAGVAISATTNSSAATTASAGFDAQGLEAAAARGTAAGSEAGITKAAPAIGQSVQAALMNVVRAG